jgi:hypothetical protein
MLARGYGLRHAYPHALSGVHFISSNVENLGPTHGDSQKQVIDSATPHPPPSSSFFIILSHSHTYWIKNTSAICKLPYTRGN